MTRPQAPAFAFFGLALMVPAPAAASIWEEATAATIGASGEWSNKVELADINGDGLVDILFANGRGYASDEGPEQNRAFLNQGPGMPFVDQGPAIFGAADRTRVIKARDLDDDGIVDLFVGNTWETESRLFLGDGDGAFTEVSATHLPARVGSIGDAELGDVDGDGDLDLVLADWGPGDANKGAGGRTRLYLGDGSGAFVDATAAQMPDLRIGWSWELELTDVDNDYDLDVLVSCKACAGSALFVNDGAGVFSDASTRLPQFANNYDLEGIDLSGDGFLDLITINDKSPGTREHIFIGDGLGGFVDETDARWPSAENLAGDDNMVAFLDVDSDGDADFVIAGLAPQTDRLIVNDGSGHLSVDVDAFSPNQTPGSLGIAAADLNGDHRLDVVIAVGEAAFDDHVYFGVDIAVDSAAPKIDLVEALGTLDGDAAILRARVHDNKTPVMDDDFAEVRLEWTIDGAPGSAPMRWIGGLLWRADLAGLADGAMIYRVCARDVAGNEACSADQSATVRGASTTGAGETDGTTTATTSSGETAATSAATSTATSGVSSDGSATAAATTGEDDPGGCACGAGERRRGLLGAFGLVVAAGLLRRRPRA